MKISIPLLLIALHSTHALFITSSTPSTPASPASALQALSTSFTASSSSSSANSSSSSSPSTLSPQPPTTTTEIAEATITPKPDFKPGDELDLSLAQKWHITTFWSCATFGKDRVYCGWHEPVRPGGDEIAAANQRLDTRAAALAAGAVAVAFAAVL